MADAGTEAILVGVRVRPVVPREVGQEMAMFIKGDTLTLRDPQGGAKEYQFDSLLDARDKNDPNFGGNDKVYAAFGRRMLDHMMDGFGTTVFAYGQTGTGKSTTIVGLMSPPSEQGLLPRLLNDIFAACEHLRDEGSEVNCKLQMIELYNEQIRDLLAPPPVDEKVKPPKPEIHVHPKMGVYITDMQDPVVNSSQECFDLIEFGNNMKTIAATAMNPQSSRGHTIIKFHMEKKNPDASCTVSDCWVVDLAGRENEKTTQVSGEQFVELSFINRSLMWLAVCIKGLSEEPRVKKALKKSKTDVALEGGEEVAEPKAKAKPAGGGVKNLAQFRNSKLTLMLANSLSGNSKTSVITTASPTMGNYDETLATLKFATSVKCIELKATAATKVDKDQLLSALQDEVRKLKEQATAAGPTSNEFEELKKRAEIAEQMAREQEANWEDLRKKSEEAQKLREETAKKMNIMRWNMSKTAIKSMLMGAGPPLPHLVNESDDPESIGKVTFHIAECEREYLIGHSEECDFQPLGLTEKCPRLCSIWKQGDEIWLRVEKIEKRKKKPGMSGSTALVLAKLMGIEDPTKVVRKHTSQQLEGAVEEDEPREKRAPHHHANPAHVKVRLNSRLVKGEPVQLKHGDRLTFGPGKKIRFRVRTLAGDFPEPMARELLSVEDELKENLDSMADVMGQERAAIPEMVSCAVKFYGQLRQDGGCDDEHDLMLRGFLAKMQEMQQQVNDANDITKEIKGDGVKFELIMDCPPLAFGHGKPHRSFPDLLIRKVTPVRKAKSRWTLVKNRLHLISGRDNVDPLEYFKAEQAREAGVDVQMVFTEQMFQERLQIMISAYDSWCADRAGFNLQEFGDPWDDGEAQVHEGGEDQGEMFCTNVQNATSPCRRQADPGAVNQVSASVGVRNFGRNGGGGADVAILKQKHRDDLNKIREEAEAERAAMEQELMDRQVALDAAQALGQRQMEELQRFESNMREVLRRNGELEKRHRQLEREKSRLTLNNEALEVELNTQRSLVQNIESGIFEDEGLDPFGEIAAMVECNGKLLGDLAQLRSGTHIGYNRVVTSAENRRT
uniref:Kinesin motor domain-containing protein n=1 Tax=Noctiluca scintillans TaxID=2966 RepID=A0A7S1AGJ9_NOCSC|eukprot:CAMPEP_0194483498 /NCGR_PEP_ID=MMETSP0253-20130528/5076_1 /TAXON_ID=2966 /ORGANISM="Noctiluca scintillans" /LENGTH=1069 /DNA_ID=CAMNT_0039323165 /DNA_START=20 /DNA_END=3229 /DNA_ORIENTATION=+